MKAPVELTFLTCPFMDSSEVVILTGQSALVLELPRLSSMMPLVFTEKELLKSIARCQKHGIGHNINLVNHLLSKLGEIFP